MVSKNVAQFVDCCAFIFRSCAWPLLGFQTIVSTLWIKSKTEAGTLEHLGWKHGLRVKFLATNPDYFQEPIFRATSTIGLGSFRLVHLARISLSEFVGKGKSRLGQLFSMACKLWPVQRSDLCPCRAHVVGTLILADTRPKEWRFGKATRCTTCEPFLLLFFSNWIFLDRLECSSIFFSRKIRL